MNSQARENVLKKQLEERVKELEAELEEANQKAFKLEEQVDELKTEVENLEDEVNELNGLRNISDDEEEAIQLVEALREAKIKLSLGVAGASEEIEKIISEMEDCRVS
jgi:cysteine sulfinate desulfinase/cysteine desulfurase-like protein